MRALLITFLFIFSNQVCRAQNIIQLGANMGLSGNKIYGSKIKHAGLAYGYMGSVRLVADFKHWQIGGCVELSSIKGEVYAPQLFKTNRGEYFVQPGKRYDVIASPLIAPHVMVNYKHKINSRLYCYGGVLGGIANASNDFVVMTSLDGYMLGLNAGAVWRVNETLSLDINHGWRYAYFRLTHANMEPHLAGMANSFIMHSFPLQLGVRVRFAK